MSFGLNQFNDFALNSALPQVQAADTDQCRRAVFFARDVCTSWFFWDPSDVTDSQNHEYGIYILHREGRIYKLADTFWNFIKDVCLGTCIPEYDYSEEVERVFSPVG